MKTLTLIQRARIGLYVFAAIIFTAEAITGNIAYPRLVVLAAALYALCLASGEASQ